MLVKLEQVEQGKKLKETVQAGIFTSVDADELIATGQIPDGATDKKPASSAMVAKIYKDLLHNIANITVAPSVTKIRKIIDASSWDGAKTQAITDASIRPTSFILMSLAPDVSDKVKDDYVSSALAINEQKTGAIIFKYTGVKPSYDFAVDLCIM